MNKLQLHSAIKDCSEKIEGYSGNEVVGIGRVMKLYGSNANSFVIKVINKKNIVQEYFLKFNDINKITDEILGYEKISKYLNTPKILLTSDKKINNSGWILFEQIRGQLITERYINQDFNDNHDALCEIEERKECELVKMYQATRGEISFNDYLKVPANLLFRNRIDGDRYRDFYQNTNNINISRYFDKEIILNNKSFDTKIEDVVFGIKNKYNSGIKTDRVPAYLGHGDAHHGNIIIGYNNKPWFIDNEYSGVMPALMELSKPYYNDFLGELFFHYHNTLFEYFEIKSFVPSKTRVKMDVKIKRPLNIRTKITKMKLTHRKEIINSGGAADFLSFHDYMVMCHILTKDPNKYPTPVQQLFLPFVLILNQFDYLNPETIYNYF